MMHVYLVLYKVALKKTPKQAVIKGTLMQIWKSLYVF